MQRNPIFERTLPKLVAGEDYRREHDGGDAFLSQSTESSLCLFCGAWYKWDEPHGQIIGGCYPPQPTNAERKANITDQNSTTRPDTTPEQKRRNAIRREMEQEMLRYIDGDAENGPRSGVPYPSEAEWEALIDEEIDAQDEANELSDHGPDGPRGDYQADYWFTAGGPDEPEQEPERDYPSGREL